MARKSQRKNKRKAQEEAAAAAAAASMTAGNSSNNAAPPASTAAPRKLTGATLNMKFMRRKTEQTKMEQQKQMQASPAASQKVDDDPMQIDQEEAKTFQAEAPSALVASYAQQHGLMEENSLVDPTPATTADMYGIGVEVIGRRSFGGFNRAMEDTWKSSLRANKDGVHSSGGDSEKRKEKAATDDELLAKYAKIVKQRSSNNNNNSSNRNGSRPIGNLGDKVTPRKGMRQNPPKGSGEKRKRN